MAGFSSILLDPWGWPATGPAAFVRALYASWGRLRAARYAIEDLQRANELACRGQGRRPGSCSGGPGVFRAGWWLNAIRGPDPGVAAV